MTLRTPSSICTVWHGPAFGSKMPKPTPKKSCLGELSFVRKHSIKSRCLPRNLGSRPMIFWATYYLAVFNRLYPINVRVNSVGGRNLSIGRGGCIPQMSRVFRSLKITLLFKKILTEVISCVREGHFPSHRFIQLKFKKSTASIINS